MVNFTPQVAWIEKKGALVWLSLYAGVLGGGGYLASLIFNSLWGMFISWLIIVVVKGSLHLAHAERFSRLWMMVLKPKKSWISRGLIITALLIVFGIIQLALSFWMPGTAPEIVFKVLTGITAVGIILYAGLALSDVTSIPLWNTATIPLQFIIWGLLNGIAVVMVVDSIIGVSISSLLVAGNLVLIIAAVVTLLLFFWVGMSQHVARDSALRIVRGNLAFLFWLGVVFAGIILPVVISSLLMTFGLVPGLILSVVILVCELIGGLSLSFCIMRAGYYQNLVSSTGF